MRLKIDPGSRTPIYRQIVEQVKHLIAIGELQPGQQISTIRNLADQLHVNSNTVARAYDALDQDHVISTQQGRGTFIADHADEPQLMTHRRVTLAHMFEHAILEALSLGYSTNEIEQAFGHSLQGWRRKHLSRSRSKK